MAAAASSLLISMDDRSAVGAVRRIAPDVAEIKRMYVAPPSAANASAARFSTRSKTKLTN